MVENHKGPERVMEQGEEACVVEKLGEDAAAVAVSEAGEEEVEHEDESVMGEGKGTVEEKIVEVKMEGHDLMEEIVDAVGENQTVAAVAY